MFLGLRNWMCSAGRVAASVVPILLVPVLLVPALLVPALLVLAFLPSAYAHACAAPPQLQGEVDRLIAQSGLERKSKVSVFVLDPKSGVVLARHNECDAMIPASNMKVVTTGAALHVLGAGFEFRTELRLERTANRSRLVLVGDGDPGLFDPALLKLRDGGMRTGNWTTVDAWAKTLRESGVTAVDEFVVDGRIFDAESIPPGDRKWLDNGGNTYAVGVWGFNIAANTATVAPQWLAGRAPGLGTVQPPLPFDLSNRESSSTRPAKGKGEANFSISAPAGTTQLVFRGRMAERSGPWQVPVHDPMTLAARMFREQFATRGIAIGSARVATAADPRPGGLGVAPVLTTPISAVIHMANTHSENIYAEALAKRLGAAWANRGASTAAESTAQASTNRAAIPGSWANGAEAVRAFLSRHAQCPSAERICLVDGSGLSGRNRMTAEVVGRWLAAFARDGALVSAYFGSFARPKEEGTLKKRFRDADLSAFDVYAKSGYIEGASCLSGLVVASGGRSACFSVLCGEDPAIRGSALDVAAAKALQENIALAAARHILRAGDTGATPSTAPTTAAAGDPRAN